MPFRQAKGKRSKGAAEAKQEVSIGSETERKKTNNFTTESIAAFPFFLSFILSITQTRDHDDITRLLSPLVEVKKAHFAVSAAGGLTPGRL